MMTDSSATNSRKRYAWQVVGAFCLLLLVAGYLLPARVVIVREAQLDASSATIFALLNDFRQMEKWAPKSADDPNARLVFSGPPRGVSSSLLWDGQIAGRGQQTITQSVPFEHVALQTSLDDKIVMTTDVRLSAVDGGTQLRWSVTKDYGNNIAGRYFALFVDNIIGSRVENDLASLQQFAATLPRADFGNLAVEHLTVEPIDIAYLRTTSTLDAAEMSAAMGDAYFRVLGFIDEKNLRDAGAPLSISRSFKGSKLVFDAAIPVRGPLENITDQAGSVKLGKTYGGPVIRARHLGPYRTLADTHDKIAAYLAAHGLVRNGDVWESYESDPTMTEDEELLTYIYYPLNTN